MDKASYDIRRNNAGIVRFVQESKQANEEIILLYFFIFNMTQQRPHYRTVKGRKIVAGRRRYAKIKLPQRITVEYRKRSSLEDEAKALLSMNTEEELRKIQVENLEKKKKQMQEQEELEKKKIAPIIVEESKLPYHFRTPMGLRKYTPTSPIIINGRRYERRMVAISVDGKRRLKAPFRAPNIGYKVVDGKRVGGRFDKTTDLKKYPKDQKKFSMYNEPPKKKRWLF